MSDLAQDRPDTQPTVGRGTATLLPFTFARRFGVLITDHNVRETLGIVDRAYILHEGVVLMDGTPAEIVENEDVRRVYLGETFSL